MWILHDTAFCLKARIVAYRKKDKTTVDKDDKDVVALNEEKCSHKHILVEIHA